MSALNSTMFYKVKFAISVDDPKTDILWKVIVHIKNWQSVKCARRRLAFAKDTKEWTRLKWGGQIFSSDNSIFIKSEYFNNDEECKEFWACSICENLQPPEGYANREWTTEIGYEQEGKNTAIFSCVVSYSDRAGFIGPYQKTPESNIPKLIRNIIEDNSIHVCCGSDVLTGNAIELNAGEWPELYQKIINPNRQLPYIFISPQIVNKETHETVHLIQPDKLANKLFGNALIFYTSNSDFSYEMRYMNDDYACYGGAIRVYQPNTTDSSKHRYLSASDIETYGEKQIISFLVRAYAQNVHFYDSFFCIAECQKKKTKYTRQKRLADLHAAHQKQLELAENERTATFDLAAQEEEKRLDVEMKAEVLQNNLSLEQQKNYNLQVQLDQLKAAAEENNRLQLALNARFNATELPDNVAAVVEYFSQMFADKLVFTKDAVKSIKSCTLSSKELWKVFFALANTMRDLYMVGTGDIYATFNQKTGIVVKRGEGAATRNDKKLMKQFKTELNGDK